MSHGVTVVTGDKERLTLLMADAKFGIPATVIVMLSQDGTSESLAAGMQSVSDCKTFVIKGKIYTPGTGRLSTFLVGTAAGAAAIATVLSLFGG